jgi:hypothetical protein
MKRILLALNPKKISNLALDFGCYLGKLSQTKVTGAFLEINKTPIGTNAPTGYELEAEVYHADNKSELKQAFNRFKEACLCRDADYSIGRGHSVSFEDLIEESRFADLLVLDPAISLDDEIAPAPSPMAKRILQYAECPVIFAPEQFDGVNMIVMTYDGSKAAMYAIKQFTYLFPEFRDFRIQLVQVEEKHKWQAGEELFTEWLNSHYLHLEYITLRGNPEDKLVSYLLPLNSALVVMGALGRNFISRFLRKSMAHKIPGTIVNPVFIAHQ